MHTRRMSPRNQRSADEKFNFLFHAQCCVNRISRRATFFLRHPDGKSLTRSTSLTHIGGNSTYAGF
jgi:hypothetical protein